MKIYIPALPLTSLVPDPKARVADRIVRPEVEVEHVGGGDVAGGSLLAAVLTHQGAGGLPSLPDLQHVVLTGGVALQLKVQELYLYPAVFGVRVGVKI